MTISPTIQFLRLGAERLQSQQKDTILSVGTERRRILLPDCRIMTQIEGKFSRRAHRIEICRTLHKYESLRDVEDEARTTTLSPVVTNRTGNVIPN